MGLFKKEKKIEFDPTAVIYPGTVEYDENRNLLLIKNGFLKTYVSPGDIKDISMTCGSKTVSKKNLGGALAGATFFGVGGLLLAGSHEVEYISNLYITLITDSKRVVIPLVLGKVKKGQWLETAERIVTKIEDLIIKAEKGI